jgi:hypothetical protein
LHGPPAGVNRTTPTSRYSLSATMPESLKAHQLSMRTPSFAFLHECSSASFRAMEHPQDVSSLLGDGQSLNPYPVHYRPAFAFSCLLFPHPQQRALRFRLPDNPPGGDTGFPRSTQLPICE